MIFNKRKKEVEKLLNKIKKRNKVKELLYLNLGCLIVAIAFNIFFLPHNIVCFGVSGLSIVMKQFGIEPVVFIAVANIVLLILSFIVLGSKQTKNAIIGSIIFPIYVYLTEYLVPFINLDNVELIVIAIFGAVIAGVGFGFIFKTGYTTGGTDIVGLIFNKFSKSGMGKNKFLADGLVVLFGCTVYSWEILFYGILILYIISIMIDKIILGISQSKAFYILTEKEEETRKFLLNVLNSGVTLIKAKGGYSKENKSLLLAVVPTRRYFYVKERLKMIDESVFFLVCDAYEVNRKEIDYYE